MAKQLWTTETLFFGACAIYMCMQFAITAAAPHNVWFYGCILPSAMAYLWQHRMAGKEVIANPSMRWMLVFFAYIIVHALVMTGAHDHASKVIRNTLATAAFFGVMVVFFSCLNTQQMLRLFSAIGIVAGLCAAASLIYYMTDPNAEIRLRPVGRADTQVLGAFAYNIAAICAFAALCQCRHRALRGALCTSIGLCMAVVVLTQSRVALAVLLLAIAVGGIYLCRNQLKPMLAAGLLAACIITIFAMVDDTLPNYVHGLIARGDSYRMELWAATCDKIREAPWVGHGMLARIDYYMTATYHTNSPHNIFLTTALAIGIPGLAVFLMALGHMLWHILRQWRNISPFTVLLLINSLSSGMIDHSRIVKGPSPLWMVFWLPLAMGVAALIRLKTPSKEVP